MKSQENLSQENNIEKRKIRFILFIFNSRIIIKK